MLSARVRDQIRETGRFLRLPRVSLHLQSATGLLTSVFVASFGAYLLLKLAGVARHLPPLVDLTLLPAGASAVALAVMSRRQGARAGAVQEEGAESRRAGLLAGAVLVVFTITYLSINTVPIISSQDESAIVNGGHELATRGSLRVTSPLNDRYETNIIGALHVMYRTPTEMYHRTFPGTAALYAPFSVLPDGLGYRLFTGMFGTLAIAALYAVGWRLLGSWRGGLASALVFAVSPAFGHWAVTVFNNVPVLGLELCALAVVLWARPGRAWQFGLAGALISVAFFARPTEAVYTLPLLFLVWWRTRALRPTLAFSSTCAAGVLLIAVTNQLVYGDALFLPQVGLSHQPLPVQGAVFEPATSQTLLNRYAQFPTATKGSVSNFDALENVENMWFHVRYLGSSTFAFPFIAIAFAGLAWLVATRRRGRWLLLGAVAFAAGALLVLYGQGHGNYYGFGQDIVRSSFIRYALPVYALLAVGAGAFLLEAQRLIASGRLRAILPGALIGIVAIVGVAQSYDAEVYGFNRLNSFREDDQAAWHDIKAKLDREPTKPLLIGGPTSQKLIDADYELNFISYAILPPVYRLPMLLTVAKRAAEERPVYLITSEVNAEDKALLTTFHLQYRPQQVLHTGDFRVHRLSFEPASYRLGWVDVWNTYGALDRWSVTPDGFLKTVTDTSYVEILAFDMDGNGRVNRDVTVRFEIDDAGPVRATISALDSRAGWQPVVLWEEPLAQTHEWRAVTVVLRQGEYLTSRLIVSPGVTLRSIEVLAEDAS